MKGALSFKIPIFPVRATVSSCPNLIYMTAHAVYPLTQFECCDKSARLGDMGYFHGYETSLCDS